MASSAFLSGLDLSQIPYTPPPPGEVSDFTNPETLTGAAIAVSTVTLAMALILLCLRLYSTVYVSRSVGSDDFTTLVAFVFAVAFAALTLSGSAFARHSWDFAVTMYTSKLAKTVFAEQMTLAMALFFSKISILILFFRVFSLHTTFRYAIYLGMLWTVLIAIATIVLDAAYCTPRPGESFDSIPSALRCNSLERPIVIRGTFVMALDFYIFVLPLPLLWRLQLATRRKVELTIVFTTGLIACVASVLGLYFQIVLFMGADKIWNSYRVLIAAVVEINVAIMVGCMPACASLYKRFWPNMNIASSLKARISKPMPSSKDTNPQQTEIEMGDGAATSNEYRGEAGNKKFSRLKNGLRRGDPPVEIVFNMEESRILMSSDVSISESKGSLDCIPAPLSQAGMSAGPQENV